MTKHLITPSLLSSFSWYLKESFTKTEAEQRQEFLQTLRREKTPTTEAMQKGIDFENDIHFYCDYGVFRGIGKAISPREFGISPELLDYEDAEDWFVWHNGAKKEVPEHFHEELETQWDEAVKSIGDLVNKGLWQQSVKKDLKIGNSEFLLYGRTDVIKKDTVFDIKFTSNYELGKFQDSSQHLIYLYCADLPKFSYLISDGKDWWREDYFNHAGIEDEIKSKVSKFLDYLEQDKEAKEIYFKNWESKY